MADYVATVGVDMSEAIEEFQKLGPEAKKAFDKAADSAKRAAAKVKPQVDKMTSSIDKSGKKGKAAFMALKEGAEGFGGTLGGSVSAVEKFGKSMLEANSAAGPLAVGAAAAGVAVVGLGFAAFKVTQQFFDAAGAAAEFARENADLVPPATLTALNDFDDRMTAVGNTGKVLGSILIGDVAGGLDDVTFLMVKLGLVAQDVLGKDGIIRGAVRGVGEGITNQLLQPLAMVTSLFTGEMVTGSDIAAKAIDKLGEATGSYDDRAREMLETIRITREETTRGTTASREAIVAVEDEFNARFKLWQAQQKWSTDVQAMAAAELRAEEQAYRRGVDAAQRAADEIERIRLRRLETGLSIASQEFAAIESLARTAQANLEKREDLTLQQKRKRASQAFALQQGAAVGQIAIDAARSVLSLVPFFSFAGPAAPALAAGVVAPIAAAQTAVVLSQDPPSFPTGGMVGDRVDADHVLIGAQRDEAVLTARGVDALGGPAGVDAANAGRASGPTHIEIHLPGGVVAEAIVRDRSVNRAIIQITESQLRKKGIR